jgi:hypothetical protein
MISARGEDSDVLKILVGSVNKDHCLALPSDYPSKNNITALLQLGVTINEHNRTKED